MESILDRLARETSVAAMDACEYCADIVGDNETCEYHAGFIDGTVALVNVIEMELAKVGYVGP